MDFYGEIFPLHKILLINIFMTIKELFLAFCKCVFGQNI